MKPIFSLVLLLLFASFALSQQLATRLDDVATISHQRGILNGAILVAERGTVLYRKEFGLANMEWNVPNDFDTKFMLASVTKQFVAAITLRLAEQGKLKLEDTFGEYLPEYPKEVSGKVTIHQLLNHTSGIYNYTNITAFERTMGTTLTQAEVLQTFADSALQFVPGSAYSYNNSGYFLLGMIIEKLTGKPFAQVLREEILDPLGMTNSGFNITRDILPKRAVGYDKVFFRGYSNRLLWNETSLSTAGGMYSTIDDMLRWDRALYTDMILSDRSRELMFKAEAAIDPVSSASSNIDPSLMQNYGYGWFLGRAPLHGTKETIPIVWHSGTMSGFNAMIVREPERQHFVIILNNLLVGREKLLSLAIDCLNVLHGRPVTPPRESLASFLGKRIPRDGIDAALVEFARLRPDTMNYSMYESDINQLGYELLTARQFNEAIAVFKLNVGVFPHSGNVYDSLGEAYMKYGNTELAIVNYEKSLQLDPKNETGRRTLEKLKAK